MRNEEETHHETEVWHQGSRCDRYWNRSVRCSDECAGSVHDHTQHGAAVQSSGTDLFLCGIRPIVGGAIGIIGHALGDALFYGSVWWSWVFPDGLFGIIVGLFAAKYAIKEGGFTGKSIVLFNVVQVIANALAWIVLAPVLDILIYAEPANKVFTQGVLAFVGNIVVAGVLGSLLAYAYSKIGAKSSSLSKED